MTKYKFHFRPCYDGNDLLIEFFSGIEDGEFLTDFLTAIQEIQPKLSDIQDLWMNDELLLTIDSFIGPFFLSKDIWGFAFITSEQNQEALHKIDNLLSINQKFEKAEVDFARYRTANHSSI